jgi:hypothetical protein
MGKEGSSICAGCDGGVGLSRGGAAVVVSTLWTSGGDKGREGKSPFGGVLGNSR